jgi:ABC-type transport system substrate-binding protein
MSATTKLSASAISRLIKGQAVRHASKQVKGYATHTAGYEFKQFQSGAVGIKYVLDWTSTTKFDEYAATIASNLERAAQLLEAKGYIVTRSVRKDTGSTEMLVVTKAGA